MFEKDKRLKSLPIILIDFFFLVLQESNLDQIETETDSSLTEQRKNLTLCQNAINSQLNHSVTENTSSQNAAEQINCIGITEKYLVEENCRLLLENKRMASVIERLTENHDCTSLCHGKY